jgi:MFS family permease
MPRSLLVAGACAALAAALPAAPLAAQDDVRSLSAPRMAAQVGAGALGTPVGFFAVGVVTDRIFERLGRDDSTTSRVSLAAATVGSAFATAAGPALIGARGPGIGRYLAAVGGAAVGGLASWAIVRLVDRDGGEPSRGGRVVAGIAGAAVFLLPSIGATTAYNLTRRP